MLVLMAVSATQPCESDVDCYGVLASAPAFAEYRVPSRREQLGALGGWSAPETSAEHEFEMPEDVFRNRRDALTEPQEAANLRHAITMGSIAELREGKIGSQQMRQVLRLQLSVLQKKPMPLLRKTPYQQQKMQSSLSARLYYLPGKLYR